METDFVRERMQAQNTDVVFYRGEAFQQQVDAMVARISAVAIREEFEVPNFPLIVGLVVLGLALGASRADLPQQTPLTTPDAARTPIAALQQQSRKNLPLVAMTIATTFLYVLAMHSEACSFPVATVPFVIGVGGVLTRMKMPWPTLLTLTAIALLMGIGLQYVLTEVFTIDLP